MTPTKLAKVVQQFADSIASNATFELDGTAQQAGIAVHTTGNTVRVMVDIGVSVVGTVGSVKIYDADGTLVDESSMSFVKPLGKRFYIAFAYSIEERVV